MESSSGDDEKKFYDSNPGEFEQSGNDELEKIIAGYRAAAKTMSLQELLEIFQQPADEPASLMLRAVVQREIERRRRN